MRCDMKTYEKWPGDAMQYDYIIVATHVEPILFNLPERPDNSI